MMVTVIRDVSGNVTINALSQTDFRAVSEAKATMRPETMTFITNDMIFICFELSTVAYYLGPCDEADADHSPPRSVPHPGHS